jgi:hypothetical protein
MPAIFARNLAYFREFRPKPSIFVVILETSDACLFSVTFLRRNQDAAAQHCPISRTNPASSKFLMNFLPGNFSTTRRIALFNWGEPALFVARHVRGLPDILLTD